MLEFPQHLYRFAKESEIMVHSESNKSEAFQSVHHVTVILCYFVL